MPDLPARPRHDPPTAAPPDGSQSIIASLAAPPLLSALPLPDRAAVMALRRALVAGRDGATRVAAMRPLLGGGFAALHLHLLIEAVGQAWPAAFLVRRPCCRRLTPDEATLAALLGAARRDDRTAADALLGDMLGDDGRTLVWNAARRFVRSATPPGDAGD